MDGNANSQKYFIITAGPTGSGKTGLVKATFQKLGLSETSEYTKFLIDDLVENEPLYKSEVSKIISTVEKSCESNDKNCEENKYTNPTPDLLKSFNDAYFNVRFNGCKQLPGNEKEEKNCNELLDKRIKNIKETLPNIVVFETTGENIPNWLLNDAFIPEGYTVIVSYSLVNLNELIKRNKSRAYSSIETFKKEPTGPAPRLPDISESVFKPKVDTIQNTLNKIYNICVKENSNEKNDDVKETCGTIKIDRLFVFDNNGTQHEIRFDSMKDKNLDFYTLINKIMGYSDQLKSGGGKKSRKQKSKKQKQRKQKSRKHQRK